MTKKMNYHNYPLSHIFAWPRSPKGEIGIEVEVEGGPWPEGAAPNWEPHQDGSLRNGGIEYVIRNPVNRAKVPDALKAKQAFLKNSKLNFSYRTSIHIHVNVQDLTVAQWVSFIAAFTVLEEALVDVVGPKRAGNKFCLRAVDADESLRLILRGLRNENLHAEIRGDIKYASMNVLATATHGTLEFRAMEGNLDVDRITDWVNVICAIKDYAIKLERPTDVMGEMSHEGPRDWARRVLPRNSKIAEEVLARRDLTDVMYAGARVVQDLCYGANWDKDEFGAVGPVPPVPAPHPIDPFAAILDEPRVGPIGAPVAGLGMNEMWRFAQADVDRLNAREEVIRARVAARLQRQPAPRAGRVGRPANIRPDGF